MGKKTTARRKSTAAKAAKPKKKAAPKNSLVANINRRKKKGISRSKKDSTISPQAYEQMRKGWPEKKE